MIFEENFYEIYLKNNDIGELWEIILLEEELREKINLLEEELLKEINLLSKDCLDIGIQYFADKEFFIQETESKNVIYIEFLFLYYQEKIKIYKRKKEQSKFDLIKEISRNEIEEIYKTSKNSKVLLVKLKNQKYQFLKERSSPVYYDDITLIENFIICEINENQYLCNLNSLDIKKNYIIKVRYGNYIELVKEDKRKTGKAKICIVLNDTSYQEINSLQKFKEINIMALEIKEDSKTEKGIYIKDLKGSPVVDEKINATLKSCHILKGKAYPQNKEFKYLSVIEKKERSTKREMGGANKTLEKKEYLIIPLFENTQHIHIFLEDLSKFKGNILKDDVMQFEENKKKHIEYKKNIITLKEEKEEIASIFIIALYKDHEENKMFLRIICITKNKKEEDGNCKQYEIKEKTDLIQLQFSENINNEIETIYNEKILKK